MKPRYYVPQHGQWSGGGTAVLSNFVWAAERHPRLTLEDGQIAVLNRNVPASTMTDPYVSIPQNAWAWSGPRHGPREHARLVLMRVLSERTMRRALGVVRVTEAIPEIGVVHPMCLANPLDPGYEDAVSVPSSLISVDPPNDFFISVGSLNSYRGLEVLLRAYSRFRANGGRTSLMIVGRGDPGYRRRLEGWAAGMPDVLLLTDGLPRAQCVALMGRSRAVVLPSYVEASPFSLLEALASNPAVIATDIPGNQGTVPAGTPHPDYFEAGDHGALADRLHHASVCEPRDMSPHPLASADFRAVARDSWSDRLLESLDCLAGS